MFDSERDEGVTTDPLESTVPQLQQSSGDSDSPAKIASPVNTPTQQVSLWML